jgi:regulatory protein
MNLLARREHSQLELGEKLKSRFDAPGVVDRVVAALADENLQSDQRFAESFVRQRLSRGHGPLRLRQEIKQRGLSESDLDAALASVEPDWFELAERCYCKKFGAGPPEDIRDKARRVRFMSYRGFARDHYEHLID